MNLNPLENTCAFCRRNEYCSDKVMVKGLNKLIKEVAPNLKLECTKYDSTLSNDPFKNYRQDALYNISLSQGVQC